MLSRVSSSLRTAAAAAHRPALARALNVHEYVSMEIMGGHGVRTPKCVAIDDPSQAAAAFQEIQGGQEDVDVVVKAQVLAGGRGLGTFTNGFKGGVHMATNQDQAVAYAESMLGQTLVTKQTGEEGLPVNKVLLMERMYMRREMYLSILLDRSYNGPVMVGSPSGGTSIEDVAEATPELIFKEPIDINEGLTDETAARMATNLGCAEGTQPHAEAVELMHNLYGMFLQRDATLVEINPLAETPDGHVVVCDAKLNFDDNAEFRQQEVHAFRDRSQEDKREIQAAEHDLNYIGLTGSIGCLVNGAGLAMATMDIIQLHGGSPANFLDVGGGATEEQVEAAFKLLEEDESTKALLVNIFGGIMRCDVIAAGIINAAKSLSMSKPIVVRLQGTNVEQARQLIEASPLRMILENDLDEAAIKAVKLADIVKQAEEIQLGVSFSEDGFIPL